jgi:hypothetical protein
MRESQGYSEPWPSPKYLKFGLKKKYLLQWTLSALFPIWVIGQVDILGWKCWLGSVLWVCLCICEELGHERHVGDVHVLLAHWEYICTEFVQVQGHLPRFSCHKRHGSVNFFPWVPCSRWSLCLQVRVASPFPSHQCALSRAARAKLLWVVTTPTNLSPRRGQASSGKYWSVLCLFHIPYRSVKLTELFSLTLMSCLGRNRGMSPWSSVVGSSTANHTTHVFPDQPRASIVIYVSQWYSPRLWKGDKFI